MRLSALSGVVCLRLGRVVLVAVVVRWFMKLVVWFLCNSMILVECNVGRCTWLSTVFLVLGWGGVLMCAVALCSCVMVLLMSSVAVI